MYWSVTPCIFAQEFSIVLDNSVCVPPTGAENLSELAAALNLSVKELKAKNRRLQRKALSKCKKFVVGMLFLSEAAKSDTRTQLAAKAMKVFCATIANIGLFAMDS